MESSIAEEIEDFKKCLEVNGEKTFHSFLSAFLIWLFGNLVFIPLANSLNWETMVFCTLIFFIAFTLLVLRALPGFKKLIDAFSVFPARKIGLRKGLSYENSLLLFRHISYIISAVILYLLFYPFLTNFHPSINGMILILLLIWISILVVRILQILSTKLLEWLL